MILTAKSRPLTNVSDEICISLTEELQQIIFTSL